MSYPKSQPIVSSVAIRLWVSMITNANKIDFVGRQTITASHVSARARASAACRRASLPVAAWGIAQHWADVVIACIAGRPFVASVLE